MIVVAFGWTGMTWRSHADDGLPGEGARLRRRRPECSGRPPAGSSSGTSFPTRFPWSSPTCPFSLIAGIVTLTSLDFLGFGLPPPTPSWGELLHQATSNLNAPWIAAAVFTAQVLVLSLVTFIGEAVREAFDPKTPSATYQ